MAISRMVFNHFTAFESLTLEFSPGLNVFIGENGTGKTHIMKTAYAACESSKPEINFAQKLLGMFLPYQNQIGRLVKRFKGSTKGSVEIYSSKAKLKIAFSNHAVLLSQKHVTITGEKEWGKEKIESVYIPPKDLLSNAPGFTSLYKKREIHFEEYYIDILTQAYLPALRGPSDQARKQLLESLRKIMDGKVTTKQEEFFLKNRQGELEFTLLAEGLRKLGLLWLLIQNGTLAKGSVLFWDEPEANLNPKIIKTLVEILLTLQRIDTQIFIATHDYVLLKEIDLQAKKSDKIKFHSLFRDKESKEIECRSVWNFNQIHPNTISDTFSDIYNREIKKTFGRD